MIVVSLVFNGAEAIFFLEQFPPHHRGALSSKASPEMSRSTALDANDGGSDVQYEDYFCNDSLNL